MLISIELILFRYNQNTFPCYLFNFRILLNYHMNSSVNWFLPTKIVKFMHFETDVKVIWWNSFSCMFELQKYFNNKQVFYITSHATAHKQLIFQLNSDFKTWGNKIIKISLEKHYFNIDSDTLTAWHMPNQKFD